VQSAGWVLNKVVERTRRPGAGVFGSVQTEKGRRGGNSRVGGLGFRGSGEGNRHIDTQLGSGTSDGTGPAGF